jgi:hypothetical protein
MRFFAHANACCLQQFVETAAHRGVGCTFFCHACGYQGILSPRISFFRTTAADGLSIISCTHLMFLALLKWLRLHAKQELPYEL